MAIRHLTPVAIPGHRPSSPAGHDHPMRIATRRAAGLGVDGWTGELRDQVAHAFDDLAEEWHTRVSPERTAVVEDALTRGLGRGTPAGLPIGVGSGIGGARVRAAAASRPDDWSRP